MTIIKQSIRIGLTTAAALVAGCSDPADVTRPGSTAPASVALMTSVMASQAAVVQLKVQSAYYRQGGTTVDIGTQTLTLSDVPSQQIPISIDLATCLADNSRSGLTGTSGSTGAALPPAADECVVRLLVDLVLDGSAVDRQTVGPISLSPGVQRTIATPISLNEVGTVRIDAPSANVVITGQPLRVEITRTMQLTAAVLDGAQRVITGRTVTWSSSAPNVMSVNASGLVTAITTGTATITAATAGRTTSVVVRSVPLPAALTIVSTSTSGQATVRSAPAGIDCAINGSVLTGTCSFTFPGDAQVVLTTTPAALSELLSWSNDCSAAIGNSCTIATSQARTVGVALRAFRTLTITGAGNGTGAITSPVGLNCLITAGITSGNCSVNVTDGTSVTLTASASSPNSFRAWSGDCASSTGNTCTLTMNTNRAPGARFDAPVVLTATPSGTGNGAILASGLISCTRINNVTTGTCSTSVNFGTIVTLTASTGSFSTFIGWTGACTGSATTCQVTLDQARTVGATFTRQTGVVTFSLTGSGTGGVSVNGTTLCTKTPAFTSIGCGITLDLGSVVTLLAQPGANTGFAGYSGSLCGGTSLPCAFTLTGNAGVGLAFGPLSSIVTVSAGANSTGGGTVATGDQSLACAFSGQTTTGTCSKSVNGGAAITLNATGNTNSALAAWGGACAASLFDPVCTITPSSNAGVTARFVPAVAFSLTIYGGTGSRINVTSPTQNSSCLASASSCNYKLILGETIRMEAVAGVNDSFSSWYTSCQEASGPVCTIVATVNTTSAVVYFSSGEAIAPPPPAVKKAGGRTP